MWFALKGFLLRIKASHGGFALLFAAEPFSGPHFLLPVQFTSPQKALTVPKTAF